jgi:hypothetical protein
MAAEGDNIIWFTYTGADGEWIDGEATHILVQARVIREGAFYEHHNIEEVICHEDVEKIEEGAFYNCYSLRRVIMPGVKFVEEWAFNGCEALEYVECDTLEVIGKQAFDYCRLLRSINLPSIRIVDIGAFNSCYALTNIKFGSTLVEIGELALLDCESLERITIPLKDGLFEHDDTFRECDDLQQVDLVEGELHETIVALHLEEWRNDMNEEVDSINQILPNSSAGSMWNWGIRGPDPGEKAQAIRMWIRSVLRKIIYYQAEHRRLLDDAATTLGRVLPNDIVMNNVLPFLSLPPHTFGSRA